MRIYEILMIALAIVLFVTGMTFGLDKELARRDYEKAVRNKEYEQPIVGCLWDYNCKHYTDILWDGK